MSKTVAHVACQCKNDFQDSTYGKGVRVANLTEKGTGDSSVRIVRCTVCSTEHRVNVSKLK